MNYNALQLQRYPDEARALGKKIDELLVKHGALSESLVREILVEQYIIKLRDECTTKATSQT